MTHPRRNPPCLLVEWMLIPIAGLLVTGCSPKRMAAGAVGRMLAQNTSTLASDDDPALLGDALPFTLLMLEQLALSAPDSTDIRAALAGGFTQYAYGWADLKAELTKFEDYDAYLAYRELARKRYLRGKRWGMEGLDLMDPGFPERLRVNPTAATEALTEEAVPLLYWTGAGWLGAIAISSDHPELIAELPQATALLRRAASLDPDFDDGGLHEILIALDMALGPGAGGGKARAVEHYQRALELTGGHKASLWVTYATSIALKEGDRDTFVTQLRKALAIDPDAWPDLRLSNLLAQERARYLLDHVDDLFD